jgi:hypothetical protein
MATCSSQICCRHGAVCFKALGSYFDCLCMPAHPVCSRFHVVPAQVASALEGHSSSVQNTMYPGDGDPVGSVGWLPSDPQTATATTDTGRLHLFDIRTHVRTCSPLPPLPPLPPACSRCSWTALGSSFVSRIQLFCGCIVTVKLNGS